LRTVESPISTRLGNAASAGTGRFSGGRAGSVVGEGRAGGLAAGPAQACSSAAPGRAAVAAIWRNRRRRAANARKGDDFMATERKPAFSRKAFGCDQVLERCAPVGTRPVFAAAPAA
jgi:hypothetical protein